MPAPSDTEHASGHSRAIWLAAAIGAVTLHAGAIALALGSIQPDADAELGAPAIEIGVELTSPRVEQSDVPVGPDTQAAAASPAVIEQKAVAVPSDLPKAAPTETDDPDRVVTPNETKKPDDDPKIPTVQASPSIESVAAEETSTQSIPNVVESPRSVAPAAGTGESARRERVTWQKELGGPSRQIQTLSVRSFGGPRGGRGELRPRSARACVVETHRERFRRRFVRRLGA